MKLSTRIKKYVPADLIDGRDIIMLVDCGNTAGAYADTLALADVRHGEYLKKGYKLLARECPVVNSKEIVIHYTSTTYKDWCNCGWRKESK